MQWRGDENTPPHNNKYNNKTNLNRKRITKREERTTATQKQTKRNQNTIHTGMASRESHSLSSHSGDAKQQFIDAIQEDIALIMYGAGDAAHPSQVNPATAELVSILTAQYVEKLVAAAVDAHDILMEGCGTVPKPSFSSNRNNNVAVGCPSMNGNWDDELPVPKIRRKSKSTKGTDDAGEFDENGEKEDVFARGIDLYSNRIRNEHTEATSAIGVQSFVFPICHDAEMYTKVKDHKLFKRQIDEILVDPGIMGIIRQEHDSGEFLANSLFDFVSADKEKQEQQQSQQQQKQDETGKSKVSNEKDVARRKEMARRLVNRTGLEPQIPGLDELIVLPAHTTKDFF